MQIRLILITVLFTSTTIKGQFYNNFKSYRFINDFNQALSAKKTIGSNLKGPSTTNKFTGKGTASDTVFLSTLNYNDESQVWLVEYKPGICSNTGYYTIQNKLTGTYLTVSGYTTPLTLANVVPNNYKLELLPLVPKGSDDIISNQKWRMANLDNVYLQNNNYQSVYANAFSGQTEYISLKNYVFDFCSVSTFSFDLIHNHRRPQAAISFQPISGSTPMNSDRSRFRIVPNYPVTLVTPRPITFARCPTVLLRGDRDFSGQVAMNIKIDLELNPQRTAIRAKVYFKAEEPRPDYSSTEISFTETIYEAPEGLRIKSIISNTSLYLNTGSNIGPGYFTVNPSELVKYLEAIGDTIGDDISNDNNCDDDTRIGPIYFNKLAVYFE